MFLVNKQDKISIFSSKNSWMALLVCQCVLDTNYALFVISHKCGERKNNVGHCWSKDLEMEGQMQQKKTRHFLSQFTLF